jgi:hypothetical protein
MITDLENNANSEYLENLTKEEKNNKIMQENIVINKKILIYYNNTIFPELLKDVLFWVNIIVYIIILLLGLTDVRHFSYDIPAIINNYISLSNLNGFTSFVVIFFLSNCFSIRNFHRKNMNDLIVSIENLFTDLTFFIPEDNYDNINKIVLMFKKINCLFILSHIKNSSGNYTNENLLYPLIKKFSLENIDKMEYTIIDEKMDNLIRDVGKNHPIYNGDYHNKSAFVKICGQIKKINLEASNVIPFVYLHFIKLVTSLYLFIFTIYIGIYTTSRNNASAWSIIAGSITIIFSNLFIIGLREIGKQLCYPYDGDIDDYFVTMYCVNLIKNIYSTLHNAYMKDYDPSCPKTESHKYLYDIKEYVHNIKTEKTRLISDNKDCTFDTKNDSRILVSQDIQTVSSTNNDCGLFGLGIVYRLF